MSGPSWPCGKCCESITFWLEDMRTKQRSFTIDHLLSLHRVTDRVPLHLSPDGRWLTVSVRKGKKSPPGPLRSGFRADGVNLFAVGSDVLVINTQTGEVRRPFPQGSTSWGAQWAPDGDRLAACLQHEGMACLAVWHLGTGQWQEFPQAPVRCGFGFEVPRWTSDGRAIVMKLWPAGEGIERPVGTDEAGAEKHCPPVTVFVSDPNESESALPTTDGALKASLCNLGCLDVTTRDVAELCSNWSIRCWQISPDGRAAAVVRMIEWDEEMDSAMHDLVVVPLDGSEPRTIATRVWNAYGQGISWSPDSRYIAYTMNDEGKPARAFVVPADGSVEPRDLTCGQTFRMNEYTGPVWSADGRSIFCLASNEVWHHELDTGTATRVQVSIPDWHILHWLQPYLAQTLRWPDVHSVGALVRHPTSKQTGLACVDLETGEAMLLAAFSQRCWGPFETEVAQDGATCYLTTEAADHPHEIWSVTLDRPAPERLCSLNPSLKDVALGKATLVEYRTENTGIRQGALMLPPSHVEGQRVPLIVHLYDINFSNMVHDFGFGGEHFDNAQLLAGRGYAVLWPDLELEGGDRMRRIPGLVMPAVNRVVDLGIADPNRLGLMGHSAGGYLVLALITQTHCFAAAVASGGGGVNLASAYGYLERDGEGHQASYEHSLMGGTLWAKRDRYIENSPLFYIDRVTTPLLLVCGGADEAAVGQAKEAFGALQRLRKRAELRIYRGEDHWPGDWSGTNLKDVCERVLAWFDEHLGQPRQYDGESR